MARRIPLAALLVALAGLGPAAGQSVTGEERTQQPLGAVEIAGQSFGLAIAYRSDSAILELAVPQAGGAKYLPLFASTTRGLPAMTVELYASASEIWVLSSLPGSPVLGYYRIGAGQGITGFGATALLDTPFPEALSGGPVPYPPFDPQTLRKTASFYLRPAE